MPFLFHTCLLWYVWQTRFIVRVPSIAVVALCARRHGQAVTMGGVELLINARSSVARNGTVVELKIFIRIIIAVLHGHHAC